MAIQSHLRHQNPVTQTLKMTLSGPYHDSWSMLYGGVLTGGLLKETEENCIPNCIPRMPIYIGLEDSYVTEVVGFND